MTRKLKYDIIFQTGDDMDCKYCGAPTLVGQTFGRLKVEFEVGKDKRCERLWRCKCECGKETIVPTSSLTKGNTKSCGCLIHEKRTYIYPKDYDLQIKKKIKKFILIKNECWIWQRVKNSHGYASISYRGRSRGVHRVVWELYKGKIPDRILVLHKCDVPACINPDHLFLGTQSDNMQDMHNKKRHNKRKR